jgi:hypothetical protein
MTKIGNSPNTVSKIMPGMRKFLNGELLNRSVGILKKEPSGLSIKTMPPYHAPRERNPKSAIRIDL